MKKGALFLTLVVSLLSVSMVLAGPMDDFVEGAGSFIDGVIAILGPVVTPLIGEIAGDTTGGTLFFAKILFFILIAGIIYTALERVEFLSGNKFVHWGTTIIVSLLSVRFLTSIDFINVILLPYSTLGIAITAGLPFVIYFIIVNKGMADEPKIVRRMAWIFFTVIFVSLYFTRWDELASATGAGGIISPRNVYIWTAVAGLLMAIFDGTVSGFLSKVKLDKALAGSSRAIIRHYQAEKADVQKSYRELGDGYIGTTKKGEKKSNPEEAYKADLDHLDDLIKKARKG